MDSSPSAGELKACRERDLWTQGFRPLQMWWNVRASHSSLLLSSAGAEWRLKTEKRAGKLSSSVFFSSFFWNGFGWVGESPAASNANLWANLPLQTSVALSSSFSSPSSASPPLPPPLASSLLKKPSRLLLTDHMHSRQVLQTGDWKRKTLTRHRSVGFKHRGRTCLSCLWGLRLFGRLRSPLRRKKNHILNN